MALRKFVLIITSLFVLLGLVAQPTLATSLVPDGLSGMLDAVQDEGPTTMALAYGEDPCQVTEPPVTEVRQIDVTTCGATPNDGIDDTKDIQQANDQIRSLGGGRVLFPAGNYDAAGVIQDSHVEFAGLPGAKLVRVRDSDESIISSRVHWGTQGTIAAGSSTMTLTDPSDLEVGALVSVLGAGGGSSNQQTSLRLPVTAMGNGFQLKNGDGFPRDRLNYLLVDSEIISYTSMWAGSLSGVTRGLYGTARVAHAANAVVRQLVVLYATITSVAGSTATLNRSALKSLTRAPVRVGSFDMRISGLELDGNPPSTTSFTAPLKYELARTVTIIGSTIVNGAHTGIMFEKGTSDSLVQGNHILENGDPAGGAVWLYQHAERNTVSDNWVRDNRSQPAYGVRVDERTYESSIWDGPGIENSVAGNCFDFATTAGYKSGVMIEGSSSNHVSSNQFKGPALGVRILRWTGQGTDTKNGNYNEVIDNDFFGQNAGVYMDGAYNQIIGNDFTGTDTEWVDKGAGNVFSGNTTNQSVFTCSQAQ
jgi:parallel beta helix pectate lyase-like protein